jgi:CheY-like chemotaxis protein
MEDMRLVKILLVEDNPDDILIIQKALKESDIINQMLVVRDGQEALDFLHRQGQYQNQSGSLKPGLILLDINLPKVNGLEVLKEIKQNPDLRYIPTVMLTGSRRDEDIAKSYDFGCNSFIQKPLEFERFKDVVRQIGLYWGVLNVDFEK